MGGFVPLQDIPIIDWGNPYSQGIVACWPLNEKSNSSQAYDVSGYNRHGTADSSLSISGSPFGKSRLFDQSAANEIVLPASVNFIDSTKEWSVTWSMRLGVSATVGRMPLSLFTEVGGNKGFVFNTVDLGGYQDISCGNDAWGTFGPTANLFPLMEGKDVTVTVTFDGADRTAIGSYKVVMNGLDYALAASGALGTPTDSKNTIGNLPTGTTNAFEGTLNNIIIHNRKLSLDEIARQHSNPTHFYQKRIKLAQWIGGALGAGGGLLNASGFSGLQGRYFNQNMTGGLNG